MTKPATVEARLAAVEETLGVVLQILAGKDEPAGNLEEGHRDLVRRVRERRSGGEA